MEQNEDALIRRIYRELADHYDEEIELELEDRLPESLSDAGAGRTKPSARPGTSISTSCSACRVSWSSCRTGWCPAATRW